MGAAQDQGVDPLLPEGGQVLLRHGLDDDVAGAGAALLRQGDEEGAGLLDHGDGGVQGPQGPLVGAGADGGLGRDHADTAIARGGQGRPAGGLHHPHDGEVILPLELGQGGGGDGAAGDEDGLKVKGPEEADVLPGVLQNGLWRAAAVGDTGGVPEVDQVLPRQDAPQGADGGEAAEAGIKHADGSAIHRNLSFLPRRGAGSGTGPEASLGGALPAGEVPFGRVLA